MRRRVLLKVYGKVQGVFFRDTSRLEAEKLKLVGSVSNMPDGTVEIMAEGEDKNLRDFIEWCKYGPDHAEVEKVDIDWHDATGEYNNFSIK